MKDNTKMREEFEKWAFRDRLLWSTRDIENGAYINYRTQTAWEAWQAAQAEPEEKLDFEKLESLGWQIAICAMCGTHASAIKPAQSVAVVGEPVAPEVNK